MRRSLRLMLVSALLGLGASCGGPEGQDVGLSLDMRGLALIDAEVRSAVVYLFAGDQSCAVIEFSGPDVAGAYRSGIDIGGEGAASPVASFGGIVPDTYTVVAWAFDGQLNPIGFDCADTPIEILADKASSVALTLRPYRGR